MANQTSFVHNFLESSHYGIFNFQMSHKIGINATLVFTELCRNYSLQTNAGFRFDPAGIAIALPLSIDDILQTLQELQDFGLLRRYKYDDDDNFWYKIDKKVLFSVIKHDENKWKERYEQIREEEGRYVSETMDIIYDLCDDVPIFHRCRQRLRESCQEIRKKMYETKKLIAARRSSTKHSSDFRTDDGHVVRTESRAIVDNWLHSKGLVHEYNRKVPIQEQLWCAFHLPDAGLHIEVWDSHPEPEYARWKEAKIALYRKYDLPFLVIENADLDRLDDVLPQKLLEHGITVR